ncbi:MAG: 3-deoxy-8-phosphooctulonate synthase [Phycisphaeraceae bacterium]
MTRSETRTLHVGPVPIGPDQPLAIIAGPCVAESRDLCLTIGEAVRNRCQQLGLGYIFKASFDKANRSSITSDRGPGLDDGLRLLEEVKDALGVPVTTDVHESHQCQATATVVDLLQIPAFLCRQTDLLVAAAQTGRAVNVKKGQFLSPQEMSNVVRKLREAAKPQAAGGGGGIMLTERGTFFGYNRLVNDFVGVGDMIDLGQPVCFDVTHSTQQPGGAGSTSGGRPERAPLLARCAVAAGVHALFIETHPQPARAVSDAATMLPLDRTLALLDELSRLHRAMGSIRAGS